MGLKWSNHEKKLKIKKTSFCSQNKRKSQKSTFLTKYVHKTIFFSKKISDTRIFFFYIKLGCFWSKKKLFEWLNDFALFWMIFQVPICILIWVVKMVNIHKRVIFFLFSPQIRIPRVILPNPWIGFVKKLHGNKKFWL